MQTVESLLCLTKLLRTNSEKEVETLKEQIRCERIVWEDVIALANKELLIPALYYALKEKGLLECIQDEQLKAYLNEVFSFNKERNEKIVLQLHDFTAICKEINIIPLFLKGAAVLSEDDYAHLGIRSMTDIDIMVSQENFDSALKYLKASGYSENIESDMSKLEHGHHHWDSMAKEGMPAALELHKYIETRRFILYTAETARRSANVDFPDADVLKPTYRLLHAFVHSEISHSQYKSKLLSLRHLYDFSVLANKYYAEIDWALLERLVQENGCKNIFYSYLYMSNMLFNLNTPFAVNTIHARHHYKMILIGFSAVKTFREKLYFKIFNVPTTFSYKRMQRLYNINSRLMYPYAVVKYIVSVSRRTPTP